jgi:hypothetical protein
MHQITMKASHMAVEINTGPNAAFIGADPPRGYQLIGIIAPGTPAKKQRA